MDKSGFLAIKEALEENGVPVNEETIKAFIIGEMELIGSDIEAELTGKCSPEEILEMNMQTFEELGGEALGDNETHYELEIEGLEEFLSEYVSE